MWPSEPGLETTGLHELDRQSQPSRRGCHSRELQDQLLTFCRRFGMCLHKPKVVYAARERHYTAAGGDVQVPRAGIYV